MFAALQQSDSSSSRDGSDSGGQDVEQDEDNHTTTTTSPRRDARKTPHHANTSNVVQVSSLPSKQSNQSTSKKGKSIKKSSVSIGVNQDVAMDRGARTVSTHDWPTAHADTTVPLQDEYGDPTFTPVTLRSHTRSTMTTKTTTSATSSRKRRTAPALPGQSYTDDTDSGHADHVHLPPPTSMAQQQKDTKSETSTVPSIPLIPPYEDLSTSQMDEATVLQAVYGDDFHSDDLAAGHNQYNTMADLWNQRNNNNRSSTPNNPIRSIWQIQVRPSLQQQHSHEQHNEPGTIYSQIVFRIIITKQYPYRVPPMQISDVQNHLSMTELQELMLLVQNRAMELSQMGSVMVIELIQIIEDYIMDHNQNPYLSEYQQMQLRIAATATTNQQHRSDEQELLLLQQQLEVTHNTDSLSERKNTMDPQIIEKELLRQRQVFEDAVAEKRRRRVLDATTNTVQQQTHDTVLIDTTAQVAINNNNHSLSDDTLWNYKKGDGDFEDNDDVDVGDEYDMNQVGGGASRYLSDFVELGVLGRGGGGEVVKVKNRLDRRIYAVKKIILESERGKFGKVWATQNQKLRREVTTISRMTHSNIVRYYQAWVEGGTSNGATTVDDPIKEEDEEDEESSTDTSDDDPENDSKDDFTSRNSLPFELQEPLDESDNDSLFDYPENENIGSRESHHLARQSDRAHSASVVHLLEREVDQSQNSPLLSGFGFLRNHNGERALEKKNQSQSDDNDDDSDDDSDWDDSSIKVDSNALGQTILYIQMEFCSTTLRKLIDDGDIQAMAENGVWRLVRQILEALHYLHCHKIIHR
jgi:Protein kinase domain/RWD domain